MSERLRILAITALAVVPLVIFGLFTIGTVSSEHEARIVADQTALARTAALTVEGFVDGHLSTVRSLTHVPSVQNPALREDLGPFLSQVASENPEWEGIGLVGPDGVTIVGSQSSGGTLNLADRPYFQQVTTSNRPVVSEPVLGRLRGVITIPLAVPVEFEGGQRGALIAPLSVARFAAQLKSFYAPDGVQIMIVDREGRAFVHPDDATVGSLPVLRGMPEIEAVLAGNTGARRGNDAGGREHLIAYVPVPSLGWGVLALEPADQVFAPVRSAMLRQFALLALAIAIVGLTAWLFGGRIAAFYRATVLARRLAEESRAEAERAGQRASFLAKMSEELASSLDYETTLSNIARLAVPEIADWSAVDVLDEDDTIRRVAVAHVDPAKEALARELQERYPRPPESAVPQVIRTGEPQLHPEITDALLEASTSDPEHLAIIRSLALKSVMIVPMVARGRPLGALTFISSDSGIRYGPEDLAFAMDASARAALAVENARLYRDVQQAVRTRDEYLAAASHDLRNPLTAIRGSAQLLARQLRSMGAEDSEVVRSSLGIIESATVRMNRLVNGLLDLARLEMGSPLELDRSRTDLVALVHQVVLETRQTTNPPDIRLEVDDAVIGEWDAARLERVVANLLDNAVKYGAGRGEIFVSVRRDERDGGEVAVLEVRDMGVGIPSDDLRRVFDRFHRGSNVVGQIGGTGLGLSGARQIVLEHGGDIVLESEVGKGTMVKVELPIATQAPEPDRESGARAAS